MIPENYVPFGDEWEKEVKKCPKDFLIEQWRSSLIKIQDLELKKSKLPTDEEINDSSREIYPYPSKASNPKHFSDLQNSFIIGARWMKNFV